MSLRPGAARPPLTVVICAYTARRFAVLQAAVAAVRGQLSTGDELLVVIDHNPELLDMAVAGFAEANGSEAADVRVISNENDRGLSGARNAGVAAARGELVAFLDDDAVPRPEWLAQLTEPFADLDVIGAGGVALPAWETESPAWLPAEFLWVVGCSYKGLPLRPVQIRNPIGANMAFRRSVFEEAGGFTDGLGRVGRTPLGCEETEFSIRAARVTGGGRIIHEPAAEVDHLVTTDRLRLGYFFHRCWAEGISKAIVSRLAGSDAALASERQYTTRTLPAGVGRGLLDGLRGDLGGFQRAAAIIGGFTVTVAGYLRGSASRLQPAPQPVGTSMTDGAGADGSASAGGEGSTAASAFVPIWSGQLELTAPFLPPQLTDTEGRPFERTRLLVRASGTPLGFVSIETPGGGTDVGQAVEVAKSEFADEASRAETDTQWMADSGRSVSIVLCTHGRAEGARRTLESFLALRHDKLEIIVVDNAPSDDATFTVVDQFARADPRVRYVCEPQKGLSWARNRGLREATGEFIAFTDDDVRVDPLWIQGLMRGFDRGPDVACVTGLVASSSLQYPAEQYFDQRVWWSSSCEPRLYTPERGPLDSPLHPYAPGVFGTGANFAAKVSVLRSLGGFDQCLGAGSPTRGGEDLDIFVRLITGGHSLSYEPSALVWHDHRVDDASLRTQMYAYGLGLTAYLTKYMLARGSRAALARRGVAGLWHARVLLSRSRDAGETASLEGGDMTGIELRGMLAGPAAYLRARRTQEQEHLRTVAP